MLIDVHAHCFPKPYVEELKKYYKNDLGKARIFMIEWGNSEERIQLMDDMGIDIQVLSLSIPNVYVPDIELSKSLAEISNDAISEICRKNPDRFLGLASIPLDDMNYAVDELNRAINNLGLDGVFLGTNINGKPLSDDRYQPFFDVLNERKVMVVLHPMDAIGEESMPEEYFKYNLHTTVGRMFSTTRIIAHMIFKGAFEQFPNLTFLLPHSGGAIPFLYPRWDMVYKLGPATEPVKHLPHAPSYYLKRHYFDTALSFYHTSVRSTIDLCGTDHLVFGTDIPFANPVIKEELAQIETFGFSNSEKENINFRNALKIFPKLNSLVSDKDFCHRPAL